MVGERHGIHPLHALGPQAEGRARDAHRQRDAEGGARRHDGPHGAARSAPDRRRRGALRGAADALHERDRRRHGARVHRRQARRARRAARPRRPVALPGRAAGEGGQGRPARPADAVLDRQILLPRQLQRGAGRRRASVAQGICAVPPLRRFPLGGALPHALHRRAARRSASPSTCSRSWRAVSATRCIPACRRPSAS